MGNLTASRMAVRAAVGGGTVLDTTVRESFALAANLACMVPCMGLHGVSR